MGTSPDCFDRGTDVWSSSSARSLRPFAALVAAALLLCTASCNSTSSEVTGQSGSSTQPKPRTQSETAINVSNFSDPFGNAQQVITVAYNDDFGMGFLGSDSNEPIQVGPPSNPNGRIVYAGASTLGWSYSMDGAQTWTYGGQVYPGQAQGVVPAILWGDPAITHSRVDESVVFLANLMVPADQYPVDGIAGSLSNFIRGGCVARSMDGGRSFELYQCMRNTEDGSNPAGDLYDGGTMEAGPSGEIYVAWVNENASAVDVWRAPDANSPFSLLSTTPFPARAVVSHPRLRVEPVSGYLFVVAPTAPPAASAPVQLFANYWNGSTWATARPCSGFDALEALYVPFAPPTGPVRRGPSYSFDVGPGVALGPNSGPNYDIDLRLLYATQDSTDRFYIRGVWCPASLPSDDACEEILGWGTGKSSEPHVPGDQYSPLVRLAHYTAPDGLTTWQWKASYDSREEDPSGQTFVVKEGDLLLFSAETAAGALLTGRAAGPLTPCPASFLLGSQWAGTNYWGDYDDLQMVGLSSTGTPNWLQTFSDSSQGCNYQWAYTSYNLHVSSVVFQ